MTDQSEDLVFLNQLLSVGLAGNAVKAVVIVVEVDGVLVAIGILVAISVIFEVPEVCFLRIVEGDANTSESAGGGCGVTNMDHMVFGVDTLCQLRTLGAASSQSQNHCQCEDDADNLFHTCSPFLFFMTKPLL